MTKSRLAVFTAMLLSAAVLCSIATTGGAESGSSAAPTSARKQSSSPRRPLRVGHPTFASPHASPIVVSNGQVFVANTPADTVDVIDAETKKVRTRIHVGVDPVSIAVRPDGKEVWVSNHVSDSVSVIDSNSDSPTPIPATSINGLARYDPPLVRPYPLCVHFGIPQRRGLKGELWSKCKLGSG